MQLLLTVFCVWVWFCRGQPPDYVLKEAKNTSKFFKCIGSFHHVENGDVSMGGRSAYLALSEEDYEAVSVCIVVFAVRRKSINRLRKQRVSTGAFFPFYYIFN